MDLGDGMVAEEIVKRVDDAGDDGELVHALFARLLGRLLELAVVPEGKRRSGRNPSSMRTASEARGRRNTSR